MTGLPPNQGNQGKSEKLICNQAKSAVPYPELF